MLDALQDVRQIEIRTPAGLPSENLIYAMRDDEGGKNLFICHVYPKERKKMDAGEQYTIRLTGEWKLTLLDTLSGDILPVPARYAQGYTLLDWNCYGQDSLLLRMEPGRFEAAAVSGTAAAPALRGLVMAEDNPLIGSEQEWERIPDPCRFTLSEDNVCLLDMAKWKIDSGAWQMCEEMLRIEVKAKQSLNMSTATVNGAQPWIMPDEKPEHTLTVQSGFVSDIEYDDALLALEDRADCTVLFNGEPVDTAQQGVYVDDSIQTVRLGRIRKGVNTIEVTKPFTVRTKVENMFVLGKFGVRVTGREIRVIPMPETLSFGDWTTQGLPFYGGAVTYHVPVEGCQQRRVRLGLYAAPCVTASLDGKRLGNISLAPHEAALDLSAPGKHLLDLTVYASRINTFGTFHLSDYQLNWFGPHAWRSTGIDWSYAYRLQPTGLLTEPYLL